MLDWEYDDELARKVRDEEIREEAIAKNTLETIKHLLKEKFPIAGIARVTGWSEEKILQVAKDI